MNANEGSTFVIIATLTDHLGVAIDAPDSVTWSLTDVDGAIINNRENVAISPAAAVTVVLSGLDLILPNKNKRGRVLKIAAIYDSSLGNDLPIMAAHRFDINPV